MVYLIRATMPLLFLFLLASCHSARQSTTEQPVIKKKAVDQGLIVSDANGNAALDRNAPSTNQTDGEATSSDTAIGDAAASDELQAITDIADWEHPTKAILQGDPYRLSKIELSQNATYPAFYVQFPGEMDLKDHASLWQKLTKIAEANGYWNYKLVNEQGGVTVEVTCDKGAKAVLSVTVNGADYAPEDGASDPLQDSVPQVPQSFMNYMDDKHPLSDQSVIRFFEQADLNDDGQLEAVLGVKDRPDEEGIYSEIYVLKQVKDQIVQLGENLSGGGYGVFDIGLVHLDDRKVPVLQMKLTNGVSMEGFALFTLKADKPVELVNSASPTGVGDDELTDNDLDGAFDGYVQHRTSYDVLYYNVMRVYALQRGQFVQTDTKVAMPDYPSEPKDVAAAYLTLRALAEFNDAPEVDRRLKELCPACTEKQTGLIGPAWTDAFQGSSGFAEDLFGFNVKGDKDTATVGVTYAMEGASVEKLDFHFAHANGKWFIDGIIRPPAE
ncbi:hypothetical protein GZH47_19845 [Paenibacillus rhizovicinus]|uniref:DUF4878 domain-containing protein n=1 Tax=Paenibacillus rhizovicinus TaxID=2704463 RepID=A0A6C0P2P9_9BACL|nr:hypothetical protein [Paenibacillus rhizovicinus]QHW32840.1 hypothetical protein GZH47_19845 [Paenibacillus rhizovicinus]